MSPSLAVSVFCSINDLVIDFTCIVFISCIFSFSESRTITLPEPHVLKQPKNDTTYNVNLNVNNPTQSSVKKPDEINQHPERKLKLTDVEVQTVIDVKQIEEIAIQTVEDKSLIDLEQNIQALNMTIEEQKKELAEAIFLIQERSKDNLVLTNEKLTMEACMQTLKSNNNFKEKQNVKLQNDIDDLQKKLDQLTENIKRQDEANEIKNDSDNNSILSALKQSEKDKKVIVAEYKELLSNEREEYSKTIKELNAKNLDLQSKLDR